MNNILAFMTCTKVDKAVKIDSVPAKKFDQIDQVYAYRKGSFESGPVFDRVYDVPERASVSPFRSFLSKGFSSICLDKDDD